MESQEDHLKIDPDPDFGLLQRCRLLTKSAGTTNQTWSITDYEIARSDVIFTGKVRSCGVSTRAEEAELYYGMVCAAKIPVTDAKPDVDSEHPRGWSIGNHSPVMTTGRRKHLRKARSHSYAPPTDSLAISHTSRQSEGIKFDGCTKNLKDCRLLSTVHHPNVVQFFGLCWLEKPDFETIPVILEELMLLNLREVMTSFKENIHNGIPLPMKISLLSDTARGLAYLHSHSPSIILPNLNPNDIMISSAMVAKITDLSDAQFGLMRGNDVMAFGDISAFTMGLNKDQMTRRSLRSGEVFDDTAADLIDIVLPCFLEDVQARPSVSNVLEKLEKLANRVPFQLRQMGLMMDAIQKWRRETSCCTIQPKVASLSPVPARKESSTSTKADQWQELLKEKEQQLAELREMNAQLQETNEDLKKKTEEQEELLQQNTEVNLSALLADLHDVIGWFLLGIHLGIPLPDLQKIRHQFGESVDECKTEMLITYSKFKEPSWSDVVEALRKSGEHTLALRLSKKHGVPELSETDEAEVQSVDTMALYGADHESEDEVQKLVNDIKAKDSELQKTFDQLQREQTTKESLERELATLREDLSSLDTGKVSVQQSRQELTQQLFLKEREKHYLSLIDMGHQNKGKKFHGNELDVILAEKDMEITRVRNKLTEIETQFTKEKSRSEELKTKLVSVESELAIKGAHIEELEKSKQELNKYLSDERHRVDVLLMKVAIIPEPIHPSAIVSSKEFEIEATPIVRSRTRAQNCCVIL